MTLEMLQSKFILTVFALSILLSSCVTQKACLRKFPNSADTVKIVILKDSIVFRDTTLFITLPEVVKYDTVVIPCPPPPPSYVPDTAKAETDFAKAQAWYDYPMIRLRLYQKRSILEVKLDSAIKEAYYWKEQYTNITTVTEVVKIPLIYKIALWMLIGMLALIAFMVLWRIFRI